MRASPHANTFEDGDGGWLGSGEDDGHDVYGPGHDGGGESCGGCTHFVDLEVQTTGGTVRVCTHAPLEDLISGSLHATGSWNTLAELATLCASGLADCSAGRLLLDVGSAMGFMSLWAAAGGMHAHALEPLHCNHALLLASVAANARLGRPLDVTLHRVAASGQASAPKIYVPEVRNMAATSPNLSGYVPAPGLGSLSPTVRVGDVVPPEEAELVVLNCQGCELAVLADLLDSRPVANFLLVTYVRDTAGPLREETREAFRLLLAAGYCIYDPHLQQPARIPDVWAWADAVRRNALLRRPYPNIFASRICR